MSQTWIPHEFNCLIRESHVNGFGHMDNLAYLQIFESARWQMLSERDFGYAYIQEHQLGPVILGIEVRYLREVFLREEVTVKTKLKSLDGKICQLQQEMFVGGDSLRCEALYKIGLFDTRVRKLIAPTSEWLRACGLAPS